jgi:hypothetical protein
MFVPVRSWSLVRFGTFCAIVFVAVVALAFIRSRLDRHRDHWTAAQQQVLPTSKTFLYNTAESPTNRTLARSFRAVATLTGIGRLIEIAAVALLLIAAFVAWGWFDPLSRARL